MESNVIRIILILALAILADNKVIEVVGNQGKNVTMKCPLQVDDTSITIWLDKVWNENIRPVTIFTSLENSDFKISNKHPHKDHYIVNSDFSLTIMDLDVSDDPGEYICRTITDLNTELELKYYLTVTDKIICSGVTEVDSGDSVQLICALPYSGSSPNFQWRLDDLPIESVDTSEIRLASTMVDFVADQEADGHMYECTVSHGEYEESCVWKMNVLYPTDTINFFPNTSVLHEGNKLICEANGNPSPLLSFNPIEYAKYEAYRSLSLDIDNSMMGRKHEVECLATNIFNGEKNVISKIISFHVYARPTCEVDQNIKAGDTNIFTCQMPFKKSVPLLKWTRDGKVIKSINTRENDKTIQKLELLISANENKATYKCSAYEEKKFIGDCDVVLNVLYLSKNLRFRPQKEKFKVGDTIECHGDGNPQPNVTLTGGNSSNTFSGSGEGRAIIVISDKWEGETVELVCKSELVMEAGKVESVENKLIIKVIGKKDRHTKPLSVTQTNSVFISSAFINDNEDMESFLPVSSNQKNNHLESFMPVSSNQNIVVADIEPLRLTSVETEQSESSGNSEIKEVIKSEQVKFIEKSPKYDENRVNFSVQMKFDLNFLLSSILLLLLFNR